jgi:hypothetical protein
MTAWTSESLTVDEMVHFMFMMKLREEIRRIILE